MQNYKKILIRTNFPTNKFAIIKTRFGILYPSAYEMVTEIAREQIVNLPTFYFSIYIYKIVNLFS